MLSISHSHGPIEKETDDLKFKKMLEHIIFENPFKQLMEVYNDAKNALEGQINRLHIGEFSEYSVYMNRKRKENIPLLPKTIQQFEDLINDPKYKQQYMFNRNKLFFHGVWRGPAGGNVVSMEHLATDYLLNSRKNV